MNMITKPAHMAARLRPAKAAAESTPCKPALKRARKQDSPSADCEMHPFVLLSCNDECDRFVEVDVRVLEDSGCRLHGIVKYDAPLIDAATGREYWRSGMSKAMLQTFVRSLQHGELSLGRGVSVAEALTTFEYENVSVGGRAASYLNGVPVGVAFQKCVDSANDVVMRTSEQIADALARWPRLEQALESSLTGFPTLLSCTASRAWVRFCRKPSLSGEKYDCISLVRQWPPWLRCTLTAFGMIRLRLVKDGVVAQSARDQPSFEALQKAVQRHPLGWAMLAQYDAPKAGRTKAIRRQFAEGHEFAESVRATVDDRSDAAASSSDQNEVRYARACVSMAATMVYDAPSPAVMFGGYCLDDAGKSAERTQLQRSLSQRGIKVVRWSLDDKKPSRPLVFPPRWSETTGSLNIVPPFSACVLLEFRGMQ